MWFISLDLQLEDEPSARGRKLCTLSWPWPWFIPYPTGHIGLHSDVIRVYQELPPLLPPRWILSFVGLCWLRSSSSLLVDLVVSCSCQYSACCDMRWWSIRKTCPSQRSRLSLSMLSMVCCPVLSLTSTLVILSFHEMPSIPLCHLWCAASRLFVNVGVNVAVHSVCGN